MTKASRDPRAQRRGDTSPGGRVARDEGDVADAPLLRPLLARRRDRQRIGHAAQDARDAFIELLGTCPPWAEDGSLAHAFGDLQDQLDAGVAFGAAGHAIEPEA